MTKDNKKDDTIIDTEILEEVLEEQNTDGKETSEKNEVWQEVTTLTKKLADQEEITKRAQSDYFRLKQEFDGYVSRSAQNQKAAEIDALTKALNKLLPFVNSIQQSLALTPEDIQWHTRVEGIQLIYTKMMKDLELLGVTKISAEVWWDVDFNVHAPIGMEPTEDENMKNKILKIVQEGYIYEKWETKKVVIPASVVVGG